MTTNASYYNRPDSETSLDRIAEDWLAEQRAFYGSDFELRYEDLEFALAEEAYDDWLSQQEAEIAAERFNEAVLEFGSPWAAREAGY